MIVDDSLIMRKAIEKYLAELGLELVATAGDGKSAIELFEKHKPDIVTLDITMPEIDGLAVLKKVIAIKPDTKVLIVTAITEKSTAIYALKNGAKGFLNKPFTEESLKDAMREIIGS
ncbi:MAG: Chemotaxis protein CheY [Turneriella sp.]|nr:Chemotaxis protein CheY [Turneriella sp.]